MSRHSACGAAVAMIAISRLLSGCAEASATCPEPTVEDTPDGCVTGFSSCDDGRDYAIECVAGECQCRIDHFNDSTFYTRVGCPIDIESVNVACGWELH